MNIKRTKEKMYPYENPPAPVGYVPKTEVIFFKPQNSILFKMLHAQNPLISLVDLLDQDLLETPPDSEEEDEIEIIGEVFAPIIAGGTQFPETIRISKESDRGGEEESLVELVEKSPGPTQDEVGTKGEDESLAALVEKIPGLTLEETEKVILISEENQTITKGEGESLAELVENSSGPTQDEVEVILISEENQTIAKNGDVSLAALVEKCSSPKQNEVEEVILVSEENRTITKIKEKTLKKRKAENEIEVESIITEKVKTISLKEKCKKRKRKIEDLVHNEKSPSLCRSFSSEDLLLSPCSPSKIKRSTYQKSQSIGSLSKSKRSQSAAVYDDFLNSERSYSSRSSSYSRSTCRKHKKEERPRPKRRKCLESIEDRCRSPSTEDERILAKTFSRPLHRSISYSGSGSSKDDEPEIIEIVSKKLEVASTTNPESKEKSPCKISSDDKDTSKFDCKGFLLDIFYCKDCQLTLNSELTWESHIRGKKHMKVLKAQAIHEIAKGSIAVPANPAFAAVDKPRFACPTAGRNRVRLKEKAKLQRVVDETTKYPMPGLNRLLEIRTEYEITYYCEICDAPCGPSSVMPHLIGLRHQMLCLKEIDPEYYERVKDLPRKQYERQILKTLFEHQDKHRKGRIRVYKEEPDPSAIKTPLDSLYFDIPGPSWGLDVAMKPERGRTRDSVPPNDECLDTSKSDFYCKLCDSHMNNFHMWASHIRGKRHLKNAKKIPGESLSKVKSVKARGVVSELELLLREEAKGEVIVGLDFIRETQGKNGEIYNCFLCGSCCTNLDIVDHVLQTKHRTKYLEKLSADGKKNGIDIIAQMDINTFFREKLILEEAYQMEQLYGKGRVEVYISKSV